jgi:hypothetical protein
VLFARGDPPEEVIMREIRRAITAAALVAASHAVPVGATAYSSDQSDLWWNPNESGWGIQFVQRGALIFATMFVYAQNGTPTWYTALLAPGGSSGSGGKATALSWSGDLAATTGTWFGAPTWTGANPTKVGTMQWTPANLNSGTLTYTVDGAPVTKHVVRELIVTDDFTGTYLGGFHDTVTGCTDPAKNIAIDDFATLTVTQTATNISLTLATQQSGLSCTFSGPLTQAGRFGGASGTFVCNGKTTNGNLVGIAVGIDSIVAHFNDSNPGNGCSSNGYIAASRHG